MRYGYGPNAPSICPDEYEFHCATVDCTVHSHEAGDFLKCEGCHGLICRDHAWHPRNDLLHWFCEECFKCWRCRGRAAVSCEECGNLLCLEHAQTAQEQVDDWNQDTHYYCDGLCQRAQEQVKAKPVMREEFKERREAI